MYKLEAVRYIQSFNNMHEVVVLVETESYPLKGVWFVIEGL